MNIDRRILVLGIARAADALGNSFLIIVLPIYIRSGQVSLTGLTGIQLFGITLGVEFYIGLALSAYGLISSFGQPLAGRLSDATERRRFYIVTGLFIFGAATALYPIASEYVSVGGLRALQGVGAALIVPSTVALVNEYSASPDERGQNFGIFNTLRLVGFGFGPLIAGILVSAGPYQTPLGMLSGVNAAFAVALGMVILSIVLVLAFVRDPDDIERGEAGGLGILDTLRGRENTEKMRVVLALAIGTFFLTNSLAVFATLEGPVNQRLQQGSLLFSAQFAAGVLANVIGQYPIGKASDTYGRRPFIIAGFIVAAPAVAAQAFVTSSLAMLVARFFQGVSIALVFAPSLALAGDLADGRSGSVLSLLTSAFGLGVAIGPLAAGILFSVGGYETPFLVTAASGLIGLVIVYFEVKDADSYTDNDA